MRCWTTYAPLFWRDQRGATASIFALSSVAICGMIGLSIDMNRYIQVRASMQQALDASVLAVSAKRFTGVTTTTADLHDLLAVNWKQVHGAAPLSATMDNTLPTAVTATATSRIPTTFAAVVGLREIPISVSAESRFGLSSAEISLALDVTGSMAGTKLDTLKTAATEMVDTIYAMPGADQKIKLAVVPFGNYVNVGTTYRNESWLSVEADRTENYCYMERPVLSKSGCTTTSVPTYIEGSGTVYYDVETCSSYIYGPERQVCGPSEVKWNGCVGSRSAPFNKRALANAANPVPGLMNMSCANPLVRLTSDQSRLKSTIANLTATGETYLPSGLMWSWRTVAMETPFPDSQKADPAKNPRRSIVLMTDGQNTRSQDGSMHWGTDARAADLLTADICTEIKRENITVYTVAYEVTNGATLDMLKACATSEAHFFPATDAERLKASFKAIAGSLAGVRLAR